MPKKFLETLSEYRTLIFLIMCLCVHVFNVFLFWKFGLFPLVVLNAISSVLYVAFLTIFKDENLRISFAYFEIIFFSAMTELISGGHFGTLTFVIGMVAVICESYHKGTRVAITATIGLCTGESIADYEEYIRQADEKLYWGKQHGKNQIVK